MGITPIGQINEPFLVRFSRDVEVLFAVKLSTKYSCLKLDRKAS